MIDLSKNNPAWGSIAESWRRFSITNGRQELPSPFILPFHTTARRAHYQYHRKQEKRYIINLNSQLVWFKAGNIEAAWFRRGWDKWLKVEAHFWRKSVPQEKPKRLVGLGGSNWSRAGDCTVAVDVAGVLVVAFILKSRASLILLSLLSAHRKGRIPESSIVLKHLSQVNCWLLYWLVQAHFIYKSVGMH